MTENRARALPPLERLFDVQSIAVVGASSKPGNHGGRVLHNLQIMGFAGNVYPIGRSDDVLYGHQVYRSILDVPGTVDLAAIAVGAMQVPQVLEECGRKGVPFATITASGFSEYVDERKYLEEQLLAIADRYGMRFLGPNCQGIADLRLGLSTAFGIIREESFVRGSAGLVVQSGTMVYMLARLMTREGVGVSRFASIGNTLNVDEVDLLPLFLGDEATKVICLYLEGVRRGRELIEIARRSEKPIVLYKSNIAAPAAGIAHSHSASILNDQRVVAASARQAGMLQVHQLADFATAVKGLLLPPMRGNRLVIMAGSGGVGVVAADWAHRTGLEVVPLPEQVARSIERRQPGQMIKIANPIDLGDLFDQRELLTVIYEVLGLPTVDGLVLAMFDPQTGGYYNFPERPFAVELEEIVTRRDKPVAMTFSTDRTRIEQIRSQTRLPVFTYAEEAVQGLAANRDYCAYRGRPREARPEPIQPPVVDVAVAAARSARRRSLSYEDAFKALESVGIPVEAPRLAASVDEAVAVARELGGPVALKLIAEGLSHKTEAAGVRLSVDGLEAVRADAAELLARYPDARLAVQRMVSGVELMLGARRDPQFGPVVSVGAGGILVELVEDVSLRLAPITRREAQEMLAETRAARLLAGWRGQPAADANAVVDALQRLSQLVASYPAIAEVDVNPLIVLPRGHGVRAVDVRIVLE